MAKKPAGRPAAVALYPGARFGDLEMLRRVHKKEGLRLVMRCHGIQRDGTKCNKQIETKTQYLTRKPNPQTHCGCQTHIGANPYKYEKVCWQSMHLRTTYEQHVSYAEYGGRGIQIDPRWHRDNPMGFQNFLADMGPAPKAKEFTVDRIDSDGHYTPTNCRWADKVTQANNQRRHKTGADAGKVKTPPWLNQQ